MKYRKLGNTGTEVSVIGVGTWQFGGEWGRAYQQAEVDAILDRAAEMGVTLIDTARSGYGVIHVSEGLIGDYLARHDRSRWVWRPNSGTNFTGSLDLTSHLMASKEVEEQLEASLRALRVDCIDCLSIPFGVGRGIPAGGVVGDVAAAAGSWERVRHLGCPLRPRAGRRRRRRRRQRGAEVVQWCITGWSGGRSGISFLTRNGTGWA